MYLPGQNIRNLNQWTNDYISNTLIRKRTFYFGRFSAIIIANLIMYGHDVVRNAVVTVFTCFTFRFGIRPRIITGGISV